MDEVRTEDYAIKVLKELINDVKNLTSEEYNQLYEDAKNDPSFTSGGIDFSEK